MENTQTNTNMFAKPWVQSLSIIVVVFSLLGLFLFWQSTSGTVFSDAAALEAPIVNLSPVAPGTLNALYVKSGDVIAANTAVALVGTTVVSSKEAGVVSYTPDALGGYFTPGMTVVTVIKNSAMKVVASVEENKGLKEVAVGQRVTFTVDAFPGKVYAGLVDEVSPTSSETGVVFSISDKRPIKKFTVKVRFDVASYPELKNGMSAKITVHTKAK